MLPGFLRWLCGVPLVVIMLMSVFGVFASACAAGVVSLVQQDDPCGVDVQETPPLSECHHAAHSRADPSNTSHPHRRMRSLAPAYGEHCNVHISLQVGRRTRQPTLLPAMRWVRLA